MSKPVDVERALARLTPAWLKETVLRLAGESRAAQQSGVSLPSLIDALTQGADLGEGAAGWTARLRLKRAIAETVAQTPGLRFVEGDS